MRFSCSLWRRSALDHTGCTRTRGLCCASLAPPHACPACCPNIGMAADATFPCRTTDSRASLACLRFQLESSVTRSVTSASLHWPTTRSYLNVITNRRDSRLCCPCALPALTGDYSLQSCATLQRTCSKSHEGAELVPQAWSHVSPKSPIAPKVEMPRKSGGLHFAFFCPMLVRALYHALKAVMHHKTSRPFLRNPRSQLLINPALPRVQSNKPQPCSLHVTSASACTWDSLHPCLTLLAGRLVRRLRFGRQVNQTHSTTFIGQRKVSSAEMPLAISTGSLAFNFR